MAIYIYLLVIIVLFLLFIIWSSNRNANKLRKKYEGKFIALMLTKTGAKFYPAIETKNGEVELPEEYSNVDKKTISGHTLLPNADKGNVEEQYFVQPQFMWDVWWPPDRKKKDQISLKITVYMAGIPLPIVGIGMEDWTPEMLQTLATSLIALSDDTNTLRAMDAQDSSFWNNIEWIRRQIMKLGTTQIAAFIAAGASGIAFILIWQVLSKIDKIMKIQGW